MWIEALPQSQRCLSAAGSGGPLIKKSRGDNISRFEHRVAADQEHRYFYGGEREKKETGERRRRGGRGQKRQGGGAAGPSPPPPPTPAGRHPLPAPNKR